MSRLSFIFIPIGVGIFLASFVVCKEKIDKGSAFLKSQKNKEFKVSDSHWEVAIFAGGCFWCIEQPFEGLDGIKSVVSGYSNGDKKHPTYEEVASGRTKHIEAVIIEYDSKKITYEKLLSIFWMNINPTQKEGQFYDRGYQYQTVIFYKDENQKSQANQSKENLEKSKKFNQPIVTKILPLKNFWIAEEYHQDYYKKNPTHYNQYKKGSGRESFLKQHWKDKK